MMKRFQTIAIAASIYLIGLMLQGLTAPLSALSFVDAAHAAPPVAHRTAHRGRRHADVDVDIDRGPGRRDVDVDVDRHGRHRSVDVDVDRGPSVGAVATAVAVGTRIATLPSGCTKVVKAGVTYQKCSSVYYRPYYEGTNVVYVVVDTP